MTQYRNKPQRILLAGHYRNWRYPASEVADLDRGFYDSPSNLGTQSKPSEKGDVSLTTQNHELGRTLGDSRLESFCQKCQRYNWECCNGNCNYGGRE